MVVINQEHTNYKIDATYLSCGDTFMNKYNRQGECIHKWVIRIPKEEFNRNVTKERLSKYFLFLKDFSIVITENKKSWSVTSEYLYIHRFAFKLLRYLRGGIPLDIFDDMAKQVDEGASFTEALIICTLASKATIEYDKKGSYIMHMDILYIPDYWYKVVTTKEFDTTLKTASSINGAIKFKNGEYDLKIGNVKPGTFRNKFKKVYETKGFKAALDMYKNNVKF